jgi:AhpD family alkylhydroperoxidase
MAIAAAALEGYLSLCGSFSNGMLSTRTREQIALVISQVNVSGSCVAAHAAIGKTVGLTAEQIPDSRLGPDSVGPKRRAAAGK